MKIRINDYDIILPFGSAIYQSKFTKDDLDFLKMLAEDSREGKNASEKLVGNIQTQTEPIVKDKNTQERFSEILHPHIVNYLTVDQKRQKVMYENSIRPPDFVDEEDMQNVTYDLGTGPWFNYMWENEFNPLHAHHGSISGIAMIQVPTEIKNERYNTETPNYETHGDLEWVDGNNHYKVIPEEGSIFLFPSYLKHIVYPWHSHVERITSSWNIFNIDYPHKKIEIKYE